MLSSSMAVIVLLLFLLLFLCFLCFLCFLFFCFFNHFHSDGISSTYIDTISMAFKMLWVKRITIK